MTTTINYDERGRAYTLSPPLEYQVEDARPVHFIKDPRAKQYYQTHGRWVKLYTHDKSSKRYYLPRSAYNEVSSLYKVEANSRLYHIKDQLRDYQYTAVQGILDNHTKGGFVRSGEGTGKALENNEPVLTQDGRTPICNIKVGDKVYSKDGTLANVVGVYPQGERDIYKVTFIDGTFSLCDGDHLREVFTDHDISNGKAHRLKTTLELMNDPYLRRKHGKRMKNKWYIPTCDPIQFQEKELLLDPYLIGFMLGDGHMNRVSFSTNDKEVLDKIVNIVSKYSLNVKHNGQYDYTITSGKYWKGQDRGNRNYVLQSIKKLGLQKTLSHTKFIPKEYLYGSYNQRLELLRGLMDSDGYCDIHGSASFTSSSFQLIKDIQELVRSFGGMPVIKSRIPKCNGKDGKLSYTIHVRIKENPFYLTRKSERYSIKKKLYQPKSISSIEYHSNADATCIKIDREDGLFITRDYIVTHNTRMMRALTQSLVYPVVIVVPTLTIQRGIVKGFAELGLDIIPVSGGGVSIDTHTSYVMHQKTFLMHYDKLNDGQRYYVQDECFVAGTLVDGKPIEQIKVGDYVRSFNHSTNKVEYKKVLHCFKSVPKNGLVNITYNNGKTITTTPEHPFRNGLEYSTQKSNMMLYIISQTNGITFMQLLSKRVGNLKRQKKSLLFKRMCEKYIFGKNGKNKSPICVGQNEEKQSNAQGRNKNKGKSIIEKDLTQTKDSLMKLKFTNHSSSKTSFSSLMMGMGIYICNMITIIKLNISNSLQNRYSQGKVNDSYRSRLMKSLSFISSRKRQKENGIFRIERTESIQIQKQTSDGTFGGLCSDGYVYNIEVEDNNNYFVGEGILVHNCHHAPKSIIDAINLWKSGVFGFTASPLRGEFKEEGFKMLYGTMYETGKESLPVKVVGMRKERNYSLQYAMQCKGDLPPDSYEIYRNMLNNDKERMNDIIDIALKSYTKTRKIIIFCDRIEFADTLYEKLLEKCQHTFKITGETSKANIPKQVETLEDFIIVGSIGCCGEGLDIPSLQTGILTFNTSNLKTIRQAAGRVRRNFGSKTHGYFIDIMDVIQIEGSKKYYGGISARKKVYQELGFSLQLL